MTSSDIREALFAVLVAAKGHLKTLERQARSVLGNDAFEQAFSANGGDFRPPTLPSPVTSEEDEGDDNEAQRNAGLAPTAGAVHGVAQKAAYNALLMTLSTVLEAQHEIATRARALARVPVLLDAVERASESLLEGLPVLFAQLNDAPEAAASPRSSAAEAVPRASEELLQWIKYANELKRRTDAVLAWLRLRKTESQAQPQRAAAWPSATAVPVQSNVSVKASPTSPLSPPRPESVAALSARPVTPPAVVAPSTFSIALDDPPSEFDESGEPEVLPTDATGLLNDVLGEQAAGLTIPNDELGFNVPESFLPAATKMRAGVPAGPLFDGRTARGRRNKRAWKLLQGVLQQTDEKYTQERKRLLQQCPTLRDVMCVFGRTDYNILCYQVRSASQQIGESGPLLWCAALDICVSYDYEEAEPQSRRWLEDRVGTEPPEPSEREKYVWIELVQSAPYVRGAHAKQQIVTLAFMLLFPNEYALYKSFERDDLVKVENPLELEGVLERTPGVDQPFGRTASFVLNQTSFIAQAFHLFEKRVPAVGRLSWRIIEEPSPLNNVKGLSKPDSYTVRIYRGDGTVLVERSSKELVAADEMEHAQYDTTAKTVDTTVAATALVPTIFDALHRAADFLGVLPNYQLLKKGYDRLQLPVANEAREYVLFLLFLLFGSRRLTTQVVKDSVDTVDQPVPGGWCSTIRLCSFTTPTLETSEFEFVSLECRVAKTKKAARNEGLTSIGKTNFTAELLSMMEYGPAAQRMQAVSMLLTPSHCALPLTHPLRVEMVQRMQRGKQHSWQRTHASSANGAIGEIVHPDSLFDGLAASDRVVAEALQRQVLRSETDAKATILRSFPEFHCRVQWDQNAVRDFCTQHFCEQREFGKLVSPTLGALPSADAGSGRCNSMPIVGKDPMSALFTVADKVKEMLKSAREAAPVDVTKTTEAPSAHSRDPSDEEPPTIDSDSQPETTVGLWSTAAPVFQKAKAIKGGGGSPGGVRKLPHGHEAHDDRRMPDALLSP